jgi:hypothetical protein
MEDDEWPGQGEPLVWVPEDFAPHESETELVAGIWASDARQAREAALGAASITALARRRRRERDRDFGPLGGPGLDSRLSQSEFLADISETFVPELAQIRCCSEYEAEALAIESIVLTTKLRGTWSALFEGRITVRKMRALVELLGPAKPDVVAAIEARVLPVAETLTVAQLRGRVRRALARLDAAALHRRHREAVRRADVWHQAVGDGMGRVTIDLPVWKSLACVDAVRQHAELQRAGGDTRPIGQIRAELAADMLLRPWDTTRPSVTAQLVIHAPLTALRSADGSAPQPPAEVDGEVVTAAQCREILEELDMLGVRSAPQGGCVQIAIGDPVTGRLVAVATRSELRRAAGRRRRRRAGRTGQQGSDGPGLRPPSAAPGYRPTSAQRRFLTTDDRHCRMPGCRRRPGRCDLDHVVPHGAGGPTECWNLCCLCRRHHRIKTFARGWSFELLADRRLIVRTPSGVSRVSVPPSWCYDAEPDPPWLDEEAPPDRLRC